MRIVDAGGEVGRAACGQGVRCKGYLGQTVWLEPAQLAAAPRDGGALQGLENVDFRPGVGTASVFTREAEAKVSLSDGTRVLCRLVIAADGRNSPVRQGAGVEVKTRVTGKRRWPLR